MPRSEKNIYYSVLYYQNSILVESEKTPLAIVIISPIDKQIIVLGHNPDTSNFSEISANIIHNSKKILNSEIPLAISKIKNHSKPERMFFNELIKSNKWNLYFTNYFACKSNNINYAANILFDKYVINKSDPYKNEDCILKSKNSTVSQDLTNNNTINDESYQISNSY